MLKETKNLIIAFVCLVLFIPIALLYREKVQIPGQVSKLLDPNERYAYESIKSVAALGEKAVPLLVQYSDGFKNLQANNAHRLGLVLADIKTPESEKLANELFARDDKWVMLAGAIALSSYGKLDKNNPPEKVIDELIHPDPKNPSSLRNRSASDLASDVLHFYPDNVVIKYFVQAVANKNHSTAVEYRLLKSSDPEVIPALKEILAQCEYLCEQYVAKLLYFNELTAIDILIDKLPRAKLAQPTYDDKKVAAILTRVTGQNLGHIRGPWHNWWFENKSSWKIPNEFKDPDFYKKLKVESVASSDKSGYVVLIVLGLFSVLVSIALFKVIDPVRDALRDKIDPHGVGSHNDRDLYAGVWIRFVAAIIDVIVLLPFALALEYFMFSSRHSAMMILTVQSLLYPIYNIYFHAKYGATVGKMACRIRLATIDLKAIEPWRAFYRHAIDLVFVLVSLAGKLAALAYVDDAFFITIQSKSFLHTAEALEKLEPSWSALAHNAMMFWALSELVVIQFNRKRRAIHDYIAGTVVVHVKNTKDT